MFNKHIDSLFDTIRRPNLQGFYDFGGEVLVDPDKEGREAILIKQGQDNKVLAVGHTDCVKHDAPRMTLDKRKVKCPQLDDRLGCWVILHVLPTMIPKDMGYDILLTDCEETGNSTANLYLPDKQYNWIFEWDRRGTDVVMYAYRTAELVELLEAYKFEPSFSGSFTDICVLDRLGCAAFNFGVGYHDEHTSNCHVDLDDTQRQIEKFLPFYKDNYNIHLVGDQVAAKKKREDKVSWHRGDNKGMQGGWVPNIADEVAENEELFSRQSYDREHVLYDSEIDDFYSDAIARGRQVMQNSEIPPSLDDTDIYSDNYWKKKGVTDLTDDEIDVILADKPALRARYFTGTAQEQQRILEAIQDKMSKMGS